MKLNVLSHFIFASCSLLAFSGSLAEAGQEKNKTIYLADMKQCQPADVLSDNSEPGKWRLIPFKTEALSGTMLGALSKIQAPEVQLPVEQTGWYKIYLGIWNPNFTYDGQPIIKARLSSRPVFQSIHPGKSPDTQDKTSLEEIHFCDADLSNEKYIAFGKSNGLQPRSAYIAYVKLVAMTPKEVKTEQARRQNQARKNLVATFDGSSIYHYSDCTTVSHHLEWIEKLRDSDTKKVLWAVTYGDKTGFTTTNPDLTYLGKEAEGQPDSKVYGNPYQRGRRQMVDFFKRCGDEKIVLQQKLATHAHQLGMKFDLMYRVGFLGGYGISDITNHNFIQKHPELRQVTRDGQVLQKGSLAFPALQQLILDQIDESCRKIDADGINLCFVRGPHFLLWEKPVRDAFEATFGISSQGIAEEDPRIDIVRAEIITKFMQRVRAKLDQLGKARGRVFTLSVWVWPHDRNVWLGRRPIDEGLDVEGWIKGGLLQSVICQQGIDQSYIELGKKHGCEFVLFTGYRGDKAMTPSTVLAATKQGVKSFAWWDIDAVQNKPATWQWLRSIGDPGQLTKYQENPDLLKRTLIPLRELNGYRIDKGLADAVYSGG